MLSSLQIHYTLGREVGFCATHYDQHEFDYVVVSVWDSVLLQGKDVQEVESG